MFAEGFYTDLIRVKDLCFIKLYLFGGKNTLETEVCSPKFRKQKENLKRKVKTFSISNYVELSWFTP